MLYIGVDIGKRRHQAAFVDSTGSQVHPSLAFDNTEDGFSLFFQALNTACAHDTPVIGMEATGHYWLNLYACILSRDFEVHVINPIQTDAIRRMNIRKTKTDTVDCYYIAQVLRIGEYSDVSLQSDDIAELRQLCRYRYGLVDEISSIKNQILGLIDRIFPEYHTFFSDVFGKASMELLKRYTTPDAMGKVPIKRLTELLRKHSNGHLGEERALRIKEACKHSVGISGVNAAFVLQLQLQLRQIEFMQSHLDLLEKSITEIYNRFPCYLHTIKGVGVLSAAVILSEIGDISRFDSPKKLVAFAGIDPSVYQSGDYSSSHGKMSKRGSPYLRRAFWNAADAASRCNPVLQDFYQKKRSEGKDHMTSVGATARKLCFICFAILRDQVPFLPAFSS